MALFSIIVTENNDADDKNNNKNNNLTTAQRPTTTTSNKLWSDKKGLSTDAKKFYFQNLYLAVKRYKGSIQKNKMEIFN